MDSVLRPRDIQARIRSGESPEDVAAAAQTSVDRIMGFATPVLAERAYQAELAQKASVRRRAATGAVGHLGQAVESFLEPHGLGADDVEWDAWRREDGRWTVLATYLSGAAQQTARFTFDTGGRFVVADNDEARLLVGERTAEPEPAAAPGPADSPETSESPDDDAPSTDQLALGDDTLGMVLGRSTGPVPAEPPAAPAPAGEPEVTEDLSPVVRAVRSTPPAGTGDADWMVTQASERPEPKAPKKPARPARPALDDEPALFDAPEAAEAVEAVEAVEVTDTADAAEEPTVEPAARVAEPATSGTLDAPTEEPTEEPAAVEEPAAEEPPAKQPARAVRGRGRASVPSWDEIMFGTPKDS